MLLRKRKPLTLASIIFLVKLWRRRFGGRKIWSKEFN